MDKRFLRCSGYATRYAYDRRLDAASNQARPCILDIVHVASLSTNGKMSEAGMSPTIGKPWTHSVGRRTSWCCAAALSAAIVATLRPPETDRTWGGIAATHRLFQDASILCAVEQACWAASLLATRRDGYAHASATRLTACCKYAPGRSLSITGTWAGEGEPTTCRKWSSQPLAEATTGCTAAALLRR